MRTRPARDGILVILCLQVAKYIAKAIFVYKPAVGLLGCHCSSFFVRVRRAGAPELGWASSTARNCESLNKIVGDSIIIPPDTCCLIFGRRKIFVSYNRSIGDVNCC